MALPDISPCRYCGKVPKVQTRKQAVQTEEGPVMREFHKVIYNCAKSEYAREKLGDTETSNLRLAIKNHNASNDLNGPDLVMPVDSEL